MNFVVSDVYLLSELDGDLRRVVNLSLNIQQNTVYQYQCCLFARFTTILARN